MGKSAAVVGDRYLLACHVNGLIVPVGMSVYGGNIDKLMGCLLSAVWWLIL